MEKNLSNLLSSLKVLSKLIECYKFEKELRLKVTEEIILHHKKIKENNQKLINLEQEPNLLLESYSKPRIILRYFNTLHTFIFLETNTFLLYFLKDYPRVFKCLYIVSIGFLLTLVANFCVFNFLNLVVERRVYNDYMIRLNPYSNFIRKEFIKNKDKIHPYTLYKIEQAEKMFYK